MHGCAKFKKESGAAIEKVSFVWLSSLRTFMCFK